MRKFVANKILKLKISQITLFNNCCSSMDMVSKISSLFMRGTLSELRPELAELTPSLLNATNFTSMSFSRRRACFLTSENETKTNIKLLVVQNIKLSL